MPEKKLRIENNAITMNFNFQEHIPTDFHDTSRVWIYQSNRLFSIQEAFQLEEMLEKFVADWKTHGTPVKGYANLFFGQFILFMADETAAGVSGCSTDTSVRLVKEVEQKFNVDLFNRQNLAFLVKDKIQIIPLNQFEYAIQNNFISPDTLYFNNTVLTKKEMADKWILPVKDSWLNKKIHFYSKINCLAEAIKSITLNPNTQCLIPIFPATILALFH